MVTADAVALSLADLRRYLSHRCEEMGGQSAFARFAGVSPSQVSEALSGRRDPSETIINALGFVRVDRYVPVRRPEGKRS